MGKAYDSSVIYPNVVIYEKDFISDRDGKKWGVAVTRDGTVRIFIGGYVMEITAQQMIRFLRSCAYRWQSYGKWILHNLIVYHNPVEYATETISEIDGQVWSIADVKDGAEPCTRVAIINTQLVDDAPIAFTEISSRQRSDFLRSCGTIDFLGALGMLPL